MKKIHPKHTPLVMTFLMSAFMALLMSGVITAVNQGFSGAFFGQWMHAYSIAWPTAFCIMFVLRPFVMWLTSQIIAAPQK